MDITTINHFLFPIVLFIGYFFLICCLIPTSAKPETKLTIKEAFSSEFDPALSPELNQVTPPSKSKNDSKQSDFFECQSIREIRTYIKEHNLQSLIRNHTGKTVSQCRKQELISALNA